MHSCTGYGVSVARVCLCVRLGGDSLQRGKERERLCSGHLGDAARLDLLDDALHGEADVGDLRVEHVLHTAERSWR